MCFDQGEGFGSAHCFPQQAGLLRKGSAVMIKDRPCKVASTSSSGKHGHAKIHIVALDIFTGQKYEDLCPSSHNVNVPFVKRLEFKVLSADDQSGEVILQDMGTGEIKEDLNLPRFVKVGDPTSDDMKVSEKIVELVNKGEDVMAIVLQACGEEKIIAVKPV